MNVYWTYNNFTPQMQKILLKEAKRNLTKENIKDIKRKIKKDKIKKYFTQIKQVVNNFFLYKNPKVGVI